MLELQDTTLIVHCQGASGVVPATPMAQRNKKFLRRFFQKAATFFL
jgi:hypothetical protein